MDKQSQQRKKSINDIYTWEIVDISYQIRPLDFKQTQTKNKSALVYKVGYRLWNSVHFVSDFPILLFRVHTNWNGSERKICGFEKRAKSKNKIKTRTDSRQRRIKIILITTNCVNESGAIEFRRLTDFNVTLHTVDAIGNVSIGVVVVTAVSFIVSVNVRF